jgi:hypothetical protein
MRSSAFRMPVSLLGAAVGLAALLISTSVHAQALRVTAANASNSSVYDVNFAGSGGSITRLNTDQNQYVSFRSLVFIANTLTGKIDLLVADTSSSEIVRYANATGVATSVWSTAVGPGPRYPDGLSVDGEGNLFVVSMASGSPKRAELWVFPRDTAVAAGAAFLEPRLVDRSFGGVAVQVLEESLVARTTSAAASAGDLVVLASSPARVFVYSASNVQGVLNGSPPISPSRTLISGAQFPTGVSPGGMDFWPVDDNLLITTAAGTILRYSFTATTATRRGDFATGLGNGKFKIKTGLQTGVAYAFIANNNGGQILKFGAPAALGGSNPPLATVTTGVQRPQGLAATNLAATSAAACLESAGGCNVLGNVIKHSVEGVQSLAGYVIEDVCIVQADPRVTQFGTCTGHTLPVAQVCAGYGATVIPDYLCGGSGNSGSAFALVKSQTNSVDTAKGALIANEAFSEGVLSGSSAPCPQTVLGWAPTADEGSIVEGNNMLELTGICGSSGGFSRGMSVWGVGLKLNEAALPGKNATDSRVQFAAGKYDSLQSTIALASIQSAFKTSLSACIGSSRTNFDRKKYGDAASGLVSCDALVAANESAFAATSFNPNPTGEIRGRLANLYLTIDSRILGHAPLAAWPP